VPVFFHSPLPRWNITKRIKVESRPCILQPGGNVKLRRYQLSKRVASAGLCFASDFRTNPSPGISAPEIVFLQAMSQTPQN
jgi:hypothetical protein